MYYKNEGFTFLTWLVWNSLNIDLQCRLSSPLHWQSPLAQSLSQCASSKIVLPASIALARLPVSIRDVLRGWAVITESVSSLVVKEPPVITMFSFWSEMNAKKDQFFHHYIRIVPNLSLKIIVFNLFSLSAYLKKPFRFLGGTSIQLSSIWKCYNLFEPNSIYYSIRVNLVFSFRIASRLVFVAHV